MMKDKVNTWRDLDTYKTAFELQQDIFKISKMWSREESFSLTDQIHRASRSIGANIVESWSKRKYPAHFKSKLTDSDAELQETMHWLDTAKACEYISADVHTVFNAKAEIIGKQLGAMINKYEPFCF